MNVLREVTVWDTDIQPNHTYLVDGDHIVAYITQGSNNPVYLQSKMRLDRRGRKFEKLKSNPFVQNK